MATRALNQTPSLFKVVIQRPVIGKRSTDELRCLNRRVVVVGADTVNRGLAHLRDVLTRLGILANTTGEIVSIEPAPECVVIAS